MQTKRSRTNKLTTNSYERQNRAIVNLQQLSQSPWHHPYDEAATIQQPIIEQKVNTNTHESTQLPLNPKQKHYQSPIRTKFHSISIDMPRSNTIQNTTFQPESSGARLGNRKVQPLTSLNFYDDTKRSYNTFDDRSRLNQQIQMFASRIRHQGKLLNSMEITRSRTNGIKQPNSTSISFKTNIAKRSFFYKQFKNLLYSSFKVDGKPVEIKRDKYSIESHGLPKKKSIYSFKEKNQTDLFAFNKTDVLRKKVGRYDMEGQNEEMRDMQQKNKTKKSSSVQEEENFSIINRSLHVRGNERDGRRKLKGKLILGRPPTTLVCEEG